MAHVSVEYSSGVIGVFDSKEAAIRAVIHLRASRFKPTGLGTFPTDVDFTITEWDGTEAVEFLDWAKVDRECAERVESLFETKETQRFENAIQLRMQEEGYPK